MNPGAILKGHFAGIITTNDDHDLNWRAFHASGKAWVSGFLPIDYTEERAFRTERISKNDEFNASQAYKAWFMKRNE